MPPATPDFESPNALSLRALSGVGRVAEGDRLIEHINAGLAHSELELQPYDVLVINSKVVSRAEGRFVDLKTVEASDRAHEIAELCQKDPRLVELILQESVGISRLAPGVLITQHRLGFVSANAAIDASNAKPSDTRDSEAQWVLLLPEDPEESARELQHELEAQHGGPLAVIISDSWGRPFRLGTLGSALAVAGLPALVDHRGRDDLDGRQLEHSWTPLGDQLASAADLLAGQSNEGRPFVLIRGLRFQPEAGDVRDLLRPDDQDLYR